MDDPDEEALKVAVVVPLIWVHKPVPFSGVLPPSEVLVSPQTVCAGPVMAVVGVAELVTVTVLSVGVHPALVTVHLNMYTPGTIWVTVVLYWLAVVIAG